MMTEHEDIQARNDPPTVFRISRTGPSSAARSWWLEEREGGWALAGDPPTSPRAHPLFGSPLEAIKALPDLHKLPAVPTEIDSAGLDLHELLGVLRLDRTVPTDEEEPGSLGWEGDWEEEEAEIRNPLAEDVNLELPPARINGHRLGRLDGPAGSRPVTVAFGADPWTPLITRAALSASASYDSSDRPIEFSMAWHLGYCGPRVLAVIQTGDEWSVRLRRVASQREFFRAVADEVQALNLVMLFVREHIGFPGVGPQFFENSDSPDDPEEYVELYMREVLDDEGAVRLLRVLARRDPEVTAAAHALKHPRSPRGRIVYAWLNQLFYGDPARPQERTWRHVDAALAGQLSELPAGGGIQAARRDPLRYAAQVALMAFDSFLIQPDGEVFHDAPAPRTSYGVVHSAEEAVAATVIAQKLRQEGRELVAWRGTSGRWSFAINPE
jgi:hypothetical protein